MKKSALSASIVLSLSLPLSAHAQSVGDWVLAPWQDSTMDFPGVVVARGGNSVTIRFDDGTTETRLIGEVRPFDWKRGSKISCRWSGDDNWYYATITRMDANGYTLQIRFDDDGIVEETNTGRCRSR